MRSMYIFLQVILCLLTNTLASQSWAGKKWFPSRCIGGTECNAPAYSILDLGGTAIIDRVSFCAHDDIAERHTALLDVLVGTTTIANDIDIKKAGSCFDLRVNSLVSRTVTFQSVPDKTDKIDEIWLYNIVVSYRYHGPALEILLSGGCEEKGEATFCKFQSEPRRLYNITKLMIQQIATSNEISRVFVGVHNDKTHRQEILPGLEGSKYFIRDNLTTQGDTVWIESKKRIYIDRVILKYQVD